MRELNENKGSKTPPTPQVEPEADIEITPEWREILDVLENTNQSVFITGKAGTGKSTLLRHFRKHSKKRIVVVAHTGVAAVNVQGQTLFSFFGFRPPLKEKAVKRRVLEDTEIYKNIDTLIIDEISMVRADVLDCVDTFLRKNGPHPKTPFGGVQVVLVGDLFQMPPIVDNGEEEMFRDYYRSKFFFDSRSYNSIPFRNFVLKKVYRQADSHFVEILDAIREGKCTTEQVHEINKQHIPITSQYDTHVCLTTRKISRDLLNSKKLSELREKLFVSEGEITGIYPEKELPTNKELQLKKGARVMMLNNDKDKRWINGDIATIKDISYEEQVGLTVKIELSNGNIETVPQYSWEKIKYFYNKQEKMLDTETIGTFTQFPMCLAWAITVHKGQGQTLEKVIVDFGSGTWEHGQAYVALSRCTSLEGMILKVPLAMRHIITNDRVVEFMKELEAGVEGAVVSKPWEESRTLGLFDDEEEEETPKDEETTLVSEDVEITDDIGEDIDMEGTYRVHVWCDNCGFNEEADLPKGKRVDECECPKCGNTGIERITNPTPRTPPAVEYPEDEINPEDIPF